MGPLDPGRVDLQWWRHSPRHLHSEVNLKFNFTHCWTVTQVAAIENLPLERTLWDSHLQVLIKTFIWLSKHFFAVLTNSCRGKIKRFFGQFSPHGWIEFQWNPLSSFERYFLSNVAFPIWCSGGKQTCILYFQLSLGGLLSSALWLVSSSLSSTHSTWSENFSSARFFEHFHQVTKTSWVYSSQGLWCGFPQIISSTQFASFSSCFGEL